MPEHRTTIRPGTRVRMSESARQLRSSHFGKTGTIVGIGYDRAVRVRWDGIKTAYNYAPSFIEPDPYATQPPTCLQERDPP